MINAEHATLKSASFNAFTEKAIQPALEKLCSNLENLTRSFHSFTNLSDGNAGSPTKVLANDPPHPSHSSSMQMKSILKPMRRFSTQVMQSVYHTGDHKKNSLPKAQVRP